MMWRPLTVESLKFRRSPVAMVATIAVSVFVPLLSYGMIFVAGRNSTSAIAAKAEIFVASNDWQGYLGITMQVCAAAAFVAAGIVATWIFGREFVERTFASLFALPVSRGSIAAAKLLVFAAWSVVTTLVLMAVVGAVGLVAGLQSGDGSVAGGFGRLFVVCLGTCIMASTVALIASLGKGYLLGFGAVIGFVALSQVAVLAGSGGWFPYALPGLYAVAGEQGVPPISVAQVVLAAATVAVFALLTVRTWTRASAV